MKTIVDTAAARELKLYADNTFEIYNRHAMPTVENLKKKYVKGDYEHDKAVRAWEYVAEAAAKLYAREFATVGEWCKMFNAATRRVVAENMEAYYFAEYIREV